MEDHNGIYGGSLADLEKSGSAINVYRSLDSYTTNAPNSEQKVDDSHQNNSDKDFTNYSNLLPVVPIKDFRTRNYPFWWGDGQLFLDANKSLTGETIITNSNGIVDGKNKSISESLETFVKPLDKAVTVTQTIGLASKTWSIINKSTAFEALGKLTGAITLVNNGKKALEAYQRGDKAAAIKYGFLTVGQGVAMAIGEEFELAWNAGVLVNETLFDNNDK